MYYNKGGNVILNEYYLYYVCMYLENDSKLLIDFGGVFSVVLDSGFRISPSKVLNCIT